VHVVTDVVALHEELGFSKWEAELRKISGVWSSLQNLQRHAKDAAGLKKYRQYLERCIGNLQTHDAPLTTAEAEKLRSAWQDLHATLNNALAERIASRLPHGVLPWCEKWLPTVARDYALAIKAFDEKVTKRRFDRLMETTRVMFDEFEKAV
jgi:hypothetical protein